MLNFKFTLLRKKIYKLRGTLASYGHLLIPASAAILTVCSTWIIAGPVLNRSGDNMYHLLNQWALLNGISAGDNIFGPLGMEFGQPVLRFYQALFYLYNIAWHLITGIDIMTIHNLTIVVSFAASPFAYAYFLRKLGLDRWTAGIGGMLSMVSVAAFGNSFEAYHQAGIVTQSMGGLFFPWFMGHFIGMMRGENRPTTTAVLFALAFLSHAIMSVFSVFAGVIYFLVANISIKTAVKKVSIFALIGAALVAFWVFPFLEHTAKMRPVPDCVIRSSVHWFNSVSRSELSMVLFTGRLLDDPPHMKKERNKDDKLMDKISIIGTLKTRPRVVSVLTAIGALIALLGFRRTSHRFLLGGFAFSLMLFAGPDDYRWLHYLPFMKQIQTFRCTYLVEFFAFGLGALSIGFVLRNILNIARTCRKRLFRYFFAGTWILMTAASLGWIGTEIFLLGQTHMRVRNPISLNRLVDATLSIPDKGYPFRVTPKSSGRVKLHHGWYAAYGVQPYCTHWKGTGPTSAYRLCTGLGGPKRNGPYYALAGIRYFAGEAEKIAPISNLVDDKNVPVLDRLPNGKDRQGRGNSSYKVLDNGFDHFLRPLLGKPLPVVCSDKQWIWTTDGWGRRYRGALWNNETPIAMRVNGGHLAASHLLKDSDAVFYLDHSHIERDREALLAFVEQGGAIISPVAIKGIETVLTEVQKPWDKLNQLSKKSSISASATIKREEMNPAMEVTEITMLKPKHHTFQNFAFDVDAEKAITAVLPMENVPGWRAVVDGTVTPVFSTGPDLVGIHLRAGAHRVVFEWRMPRRHVATLIISLLAIAVVLAVWGFAIYRRAKTGATYDNMGIL